MTSVQTKQMGLSKNGIIDSLQDLYGTEFTAADVRAFCAMNDIGYSTVTGKIKQYKVGKGKWNLKVTPKAVKRIEKAFEAPAVVPQSEQNLVPDTDNTFVKFGPFTDIKKIIPIRYVVKKLNPKLLAKKKGMKNVKEAGTPTKILLENVIVFSISLCSR